MYFFVNYTKGRNMLNHKIWKYFLIFIQIFSSFSKIIVILSYLEKIFLKGEKNMKNKKNDELRQIVQHNLTILRIRNDLTQRNVSKIVGKSQNAVASWEQGLSLPDVTTLYKLSKLYNVEMEYFYINHSKEGDEI